MKRSQRLAIAAVAAPIAVSIFAGTAMFAGQNGLATAPTAATQGQAPVAAGSAREPSTVVRPQVANPAPQAPPTHTTTGASGARP